MTLRTFVPTVLTLFLAITAYSDDDWHLRQLNNDGLGDKDNVGVGRLATHVDWLFLCAWNTQTGLKVYRSKDAEAWERISPDGFNGNVHNFTVAGFVWIGDYLYAGTWNQNDGAAMFRANADAPSASDVTWETIVEGGFSNPRNWGFTHIREFKDHIYVGCFNFLEGSEVWRSSTGDPGTWTMVCPKAWGSKVNTDSTTMLVHDGFLYLGTETARDAQYAEGTALWRTDGALAPPYDQWRQVNTNGFGNGRNHNICGLAEFSGKIYAATWNQTQGFEVWRATPGPELPFPDWERVVTGALGDPASVYATCMVAMDDAIFVSSIGAFETAPALYTLPNAKTKTAYGGRLIKSRDGKQWENIDAPGFMDPPHLGIQWLCPFKGKLYIGSQAIDHTMELWVYESR